MNPTPPEEPGGWAFAAAYLRAMPAGPRAHPVRPGQALSEGWTLARETRDHARSLDRHRRAAERAAQRAAVHVGREA